MEKYNVKNVIGRTGVAVSQLGIGTAPMGNMYKVVADDAVVGTLARACELGIDYVDTAPHYGQGLAERRVGGFFAQHAPMPVLSTKVGRRLVPLEPAPPPGTMRHGFVDGDPFDPVFDYTYDGVMRSFEASLKRLRVERVDILLAHDLGQMIHKENHPAHFRDFCEGGYHAMASLKEQGLVRAIGLGVNEWEICMATLARFDLDVVMLAGRYTLLDQSALATFLPECSRRGTSVLLGGPFNSGILVQGIQPGRTAHYNYRPAPQDIIDRVARMQDVCGAFDVPLAAAAIQFPLAHQAVASVVTGLSSPGHLTSAAAWMDTAIPDALWRALQAEDLLHPLAPLPQGASKGDA